MSVVIVTGSCGLIGSEAALHFGREGFHVVGIDNDLRSYFFGAEASTAWNRERLSGELGGRYEHLEIDIRDSAAVEGTFRRYSKNIVLIVHTAAQPSHDWAAREPATDFSINANGTLTLLEATRKYCPEAPFVQMSTNKVYGDRPNSLPLKELGSRWELASSHPYSPNGIPETMSIDQSLHSLFGVSKLAGDVLAQEYGRYFGLKTAVFRGGVLTGPQHAGAQLHGFPSYLMRAAMTGHPYTIFGYKGKQVRDVIHCADVITAIDAFFRAPRSGEAYNIGGGPQCNVSVLEAIDICQEISGKRMTTTYDPKNRKGDHIWYVSDIRKLQEHYPGWSLRHTNVREIFQAIHDFNVGRWQ